MATTSNKKYFIISMVLHLGVLSLLIAGFDFVSPLAVVENTSQHDVISAVVLGDSPKSKILPQKITAKPLPQEVKKEDVAHRDNRVAIQPAQKKKIVPQKTIDAKQHALINQQLLADIKKSSEKQKKVKEKKLKSSFAKTLREQAEQSLRQQLLDEEITLRGTKTRQAQGEVNKYKAFIIQAISEHWIIPLQANRKLSCELLIRVAPGGLVLDVQVAKTSGDPSLDSSARAAVLNASPLPVPRDPQAFEPFRQFVLKVRPDNIMASREP